MAQVNQFPRLNLEHLIVKDSAVYQGTCEFRNKVTFRDDVCLNAPITMPGLPQAVVGVCLVTPPQTIEPTGDGASDPISVETYSTLVSTEPIGSYNSTHTMVDGIRANQIKVIRVAGDGGSAEVTPDNFKNGTKFTMPATSDEQQSSVTLIWDASAGEWVLIDRSSEIVVIA